MYINDTKILDLIRDSGLVTKTDFETALKKASEKKQSIDDILVSMGKLTEKDWVNLHAQALGIPFVSLRNVRIETEVLTLIPEPIARNSNIIAYKKGTDSLEVAMLDVANLTVIDFIKKKIGLRILPRLTDSESIKLALSQYKKSLQADFEDIIKKESAQASKSKVNGLPDSEKTEKELRELVEDLPIIKIVDTLISHAILQGASDVHIEPCEDSLLVRYRIDGILHDA